MSLWDDLYAYHDRAQAERDPAVGPSDVDVLHGGCVRRLAYRTQRYTPTDPVPAKMRRAAVIGEAIHAYVADARRAAGWMLVEAKTPPLPPLRGGRLDGWHRGRLDDLKTVSRYVFDGIANDGKARAGDERQGHVYGIALELRGLFTLTQSVTYVCRDDPTLTLEDSWTFDRAAAMETVEKMIVAAHDATRLPDDLGRAARSPQDRPCDGCPFRTRCWGPQASEPDVPAPDAGELEWAAQAYMEATSRKRAAEGQLARLRPLLERLDGAEFTDQEGIRRRIRWTRGREYGDGGALDQRQARDLLEYYGLPVPTLGTAPRLSMPAVVDKEDR